MDQLGRFELAINENDENLNFKVSSLDIGGVLIYRNLFADAQNLLELIRVDTTLTESWRGYIAIQKNLRISHVKSNDQLVFILLKSGSTVMGNFQLVVAQIKDGTYGIYDIKNMIPFDPTDFLVTRQGVMIGGYFNYRPLVLFFNFTTQTSKILPGFFNEQGDLNQLKLNENGSVDVIVSANNFERKKCLWIRNYDEHGELIKTTILEPEISKNLIFGRSAKMPNDAQVVAGVYSNKNVKNSRGVFVAEINQQGEYNTNYYNFGDLENFFSYLKAKKERRVKDRIERKKIKGKKIKFNYRLLVHEIVPYNDTYIMLGEAFYPKYRYGNGISYGAYGAMRGEQIFDGYQYTHAVVIGFDAQGNLKWDNSFEINDVKTFELQQFVRIAPGADRIVLLYYFDNFIRSKIIKDNLVLEGKTQDPIKSNFEADVVKEKYRESTKLDYSSKLDYWYTKYFFASGVQLVKTPGPRNSTSYRKVFFINKLKYQ